MTCLLNILSLFRQTCISRFFSLFGGLTITLNKNGFALLLEGNPNNRISNAVKALVVIIFAICVEKKLVLRERAIMALMGVVTLVQELLRPPPPHEWVKCS